MRVLSKNDLDKLTGGNVSKSPKMKKDDAFISGAAFGMVVSYMAFRRGIVLSAIFGIAMGAFFSACTEA